MKRILLILVLIILLASCNESRSIDITEFEKEINIVFNDEIISTEEMTTITKENINITYWLPENYDVCCSFYSEPETGIINKISVTANMNNKKLSVFLQKFENAIKFKNTKYKKSTFEDNNYIIYVYEDLYNKSSNDDPILKSKLDEHNLNYPNFEKSRNSEN